MVERFLGNSCRLLVTAGLAVALVAVSVPGWAAPAASPKASSTPPRPGPSSIPHPPPGKPVLPPKPARPVTRPAVPRPGLPKAPVAPRAPTTPKAPAKPVAPVIPSGKGEIRVTVDGAPVKFDVAPQMAGGTVFVPLRGVFEKMGARVDFNKATGVVKAWRKQTAVELKVGDRLSKVNGNTVFMIQPAFSKDGRTLVPLRFLGESLGARVAWDPMHRVVQIATGR